MSAMSEVQSAAYRGVGVSSPAQILRTSLHDQVVGHLRRMILEGELMPGERVAEKRLCDLLGISRTPLREALKVLAHEGLVTLRPNRGAVVTPVSCRSVSELFPLCAVMERLAGETACRGMRQELLFELRSLIDGLWEAMRAQDSGVFRDRVHSFRQHLFAAAGNGLLASTYHALSQQILRVCSAIGPLSQEWMRKAVEAHETMVDALERGESETFGRLLHDFRLDNAGHVADQLRCGCEPVEEMS
ncbi:MAG: GntR family transcriptional regulator [Alphaproteobacteria bacterium]